MFKTLAATVLALFAAAAFAAVDVNKASQADLETVKGIGPAAASKILNERKKGSFKDWNDVMQRVGGIKSAKAAKLSEAGLTVNGESFRVDGRSQATDAKAKKAPKEAQRTPTAGALSAPPVQR